MVFVWEVTLRMGKKTMVLQGQEICLLMRQDFELGMIDEDLGAVYQNYCVDLEKENSSDLYDFFWLTVLLVIFLVFVMESSQSQRKAGSQIIRPFLFSLQNQIFRLSNWYDKWRFTTILKIKNFKEERYFERIVL